jgi:hypothetical protein
MAYKHTDISFKRAVLVTSVLGLTYLSVAWFARSLLSNFPLLNAACAEWFSHRMPIVPGLSPLSCFSIGGGKTT